MAMHMKIAGLVTLATVAGVAATAPGLASARVQSASRASLSAKIVQLYPWAKPQYTPATADKKQFNLVIYQRGKAMDLGQAIGARLMNLYISELKSQTTYTLTFYAITSNIGASTQWQYRYTSANNQLLRFHYISSTHSQIATWYLTPGQIAQAAKTGHWPSPSTTR